MADTLHTPGPYYHEREQAERIAYAFRVNPDSAAELLHGMHEEHGSQLLAEMLEALKALAENARRLTACIGSLDHACDLGCGRAYDVLRDRTIEAEAIIRKAEGRS